MNPPFIGIYHAKLPVIQDTPYGKVFFPTQLMKDHFFPTSEYYQNHINLVIQKCARPNSTILDIGANLGLFTLSFASLFPSCQIHSFEPVSPTFQYLTKNTLVNKLSNVTLHNVGISNHNKEEKIKFTSKNWGGSTINGNLDKYQSKYQDTPQIQDIVVQTLDSFKFKDISFIKIDVQDHEYEVLLGGKETLTTHKCAVVLELMDRNSEELAYSQKCVALMKSYGYSLIQRIGPKDYLFRKPNK